MAVLVITVAYTHEKDQNNHVVTHTLPISKEPFNTCDSKHYSSTEMNKDSAVRSEPLLLDGSFAESSP